MTCNLREMRLYRIKLSRHRLLSHRTAHCPAPARPSQLLHQLPRHLPVSSKNWYANSIASGLSFDDLKSDSLRFSQILADFVHCVLAVRHRDESTESKKSIESKESKDGQGSSQDKTDGKTSTSLSKAERQKEKARLLEKLRKKWSGLVKACSPTSANLKSIQPHVLGRFLSDAISSCKDKECPLHAGNASVVFQQAEMATSPGALLQSQGGDNSNSLGSLQKMAAYEAILAKFPSLCATEADSCHDASQCSHYHLVSSNSRYWQLRDASDKDEAGDGAQAAISRAVGILVEPTRQSRHAVNVRSLSTSLWKLLSESNDSLPQILKPKPLGGKLTRNRLGRAVRAAAIWQDQPVVDKQKRAFQLKSASRDDILAALSSAAPPSAQEHGSRSQPSSAALSDSGAGSSSAVINTMTSTQRQMLAFAKQTLIQQCAEADAAFEAKQSALVQLDRQRTRTAADVEKLRAESAAKRQKLSDWESVDGEQHAFLENS